MNNTPATIGIHYPQAPQAVTIACHRNDFSEDTHMRSLLAVFIVAGVVMVSGCSNDPGSMSQEDVEAKLKDTLQLKAVALAKSPDGGYTGTGSKEDGTTLKISVTQKKEDRSLWYSAVDEKGDLKAGGFKDFSLWGFDARAAQRWSLILKVGLAIALMAGAVGYAIWRKRSAGEHATDVGQSQDDKV